MLLFSFFAQQLHSAWAMVTAHVPLFLLFLSLCTLAPAATNTITQDVSGPTIGVQFGTNIAAVVVNFATALLRNATSNSAIIQVFPADVELNSTNIGSVSVVLSFGLTQTRSLVINQGELDGLGSEGYIVRSAMINQVCLYYFIPNLLLKYICVLSTSDLRNFYCRHSTLLVMATHLFQMYSITTRTYQMEHITACSECLRSLGSPSSILSALQCRMR
jgi:hypothetical protein